MKPVKLIKSIALILLFFVVACTNKNEYSTYHNLNFDLESENKLFTDNPLARKQYFYQGWHQDNKSSISRKSIIRFINHSSGLRRLLIKIKNPNFETEKQLKITPCLNRNNLKEIVLLQETGEFNLLFSPQFLKKGENFLELNINSNFLKNRNYQHGQKQQVFFILEDIKFTKSLAIDLKIDKTLPLTQPANTLFKIALDTAKTGWILYSFEIKKNRANGKLQFTQYLTNEKPKIIKEINLKESQNHEGTISFEPLSKKVILEISFTSPNKNSLIEWKKIQKKLIKPLAKQHPQSKLKLKKPHVFVIIIDAAQHKSINLNEEGLEITPAIKEFSKISYNFSNFFSNAPYTVASVTTLLSGFLPEVHTVRNMDTMLPPMIKTMPSYFKEKGYYTNAVYSNVPLIRTELMRDFDNKVLCRQIGVKKLLNYSYVELEKITNTLKQTNYQQPQLFYIHLLPPHTPYNPRHQQFRLFGPKTEFNFLRIQEKMKIIEKFNLLNNEFNQLLYKLYLNNLYYADYLTGEILDTLKQLKVFDDSVVIISSDHGEAFFEHNKYTHNTTNYNEMIHIPFFLKLPYQKKQINIKEQYSLVDLMPTLAEIINLKKNKHWQGQMIKLLPDFKLTSSRSIYSRATGEDYNIGLIFGNYKYIFYSGREELYNILKDPHEKTNIIDKHQYLRLILRQKALNILEKNKILKSKLGIKRIIKTKTNSEVIRELKALGYL